MSGRGVWAAAAIGVGVVALGGCGGGAVRTAGNPVLGGWYADPDSAAIGGRWWIYPTLSAPYDEQTRFDAFSSDDLVVWEKHEGILAAEGVGWARRAMWAPCIAEKDGRFYLFFAANDIQGDGEVGGIGVAAADRPEGPFVDRLGEPLIDRFHNGAQPIDQAVFRDPADGRWYLYYGGWGRCNVARLNEDFTGFVPFEDGAVFREITPEGYVEGPTMLERGGKYYFMWSEGGWTGPDYRVAYGVSDSPLGPFERSGLILKQDPGVATGAGHHSVVCIDELRFGVDGAIEPVRITFEGVRPRRAGAE